MYIIAIGWLYVTLLIAVNEASVVAGVISFAFYGLLPSLLLLWISGSKVRRQRRAFLEQQRATSSQPDQAGHAASDAIAPVGEEAIALGNGTSPTPENTADAGPR